MHAYTENIIGSYIKENYSDFDTMNYCKLEELCKLSMIYYHLLKGDKYYHEIEKMEEEFTEEEFLIEAKKLYDSANAVEKAQMKNDIAKIFT